MLNMNGSMGATKRGSIELQNCTKKNNNENWLWCAMSLVEDNVAGCRQRCRTMLLDNVEKQLLQWLDRFCRVQKRPGAKSDLHNVEDCVPRAMSLFVDNVAVCRQCCRTMSLDNNDLTNFFRQLWEISEQFWGTKMCDDVRGTICVEQLCDTMTWQFWVLSLQTGCCCCCNFGCRWSLWRVIWLAF